MILVQAVHLIRIWLERMTDSVYTVSFGICGLTLKSSVMDAMYAVRAPKSLTHQLHDAEDALS